MKRKISVLLIIGLAICTTAGADDRPWEKFGISLGAFSSNLDSSFRIGGGIGLDIDVEKAFDIDSSSTVFRVDALWRFSGNRKHRLDFTWFSFNRDGSRQLLDDITIEDNNGNPITIDAGTLVKANYDLDIYQLSYSYSFLQDDRVDLAAGVGVYIMPINYGLSASGMSARQGSEDFTAPLPVLLLRMDIALSPRWFVRTGTQFFYVEYDTFTGSLLQFSAALEYKPWRHVGIGLGVDTLNLKLKAEGEDWPNIDINGSTELSYTGLQLYLRFSF